MWRKPIRQPHKWVKNVAKLKRNFGESYVSSGVVRPAKLQLQESCGNQCRIGCSSLISELNREKILKDYWSLPDLTCKREFIVRHMEQVMPKYMRKKEGSRRGLNYAYNFVVDGIKIKVCSKFFLNTLNISYMTVTTAVRKFWRSADGLIEGELRGTHKNRFKPKQEPSTDDEKVEVRVDTS